MCNILNSVTVLLQSVIFYSNLLGITTRCLKIAKRNGFKMPQNTYNVLINLQCISYQNNNYLYSTCI